MKNSFAQRKAVNVAVMKTGFVYPVFSQPQFPQSHKTHQYTLSNILLYLSSHPALFSASSVSIAVPISERGNSF